jgi:23S rRNA (guanosine2251-2'-O)-methyltransferase
MLLALSGHMVFSASALKVAVPFAIMTNPLGRACIPDNSSAGRMRKLTHEEIVAQRVPKHLAGESVRAPVIGMLDNIRSVYNVGSIFRTSDGAGVQILYLCGYTPRPHRKEIEKTALGATETVPWTYFADSRDAIVAAKATGAKVCVLEHTTDSVPYTALRASDFPVCLVVGNELTGVSPQTIASADLAIEIPMYGVKQSLNAAVAYGIAIFELVRIWRNR